MGNFVMIDDRCQMSEEKDTKIKTFSTYLIDHLFGYFLISKRFS